MSEPSDIVAELDWWLSHSIGLPSWTWVQRARDEIVAMRQMVERQRLVLSKGHAEVRAEALEEAALACERIGVGPYQRCAAAIRALKGKP